MLTRPKNRTEPNANLIAMLLANLGKCKATKRILTLKRSTPQELSTSNIAIDQLMDCFVNGSDGAWNKQANFDYLAYLFADLAKVFPTVIDIGIL